MLFGVGPPTGIGPSGFVLPWPPRVWPEVVKFVPGIGGGSVYEPPGGLGEISIEEQLFINSITTRGLPGANILPSCDIVAESHDVRIPKEEERCRNIESAIGI